MKIMPLSKQVMEMFLVGLSSVAVMPANAQYNEVTMPSDTAIIIDWGGGPPVEEIVPDPYYEPYYAQGYGPDYNAYYNPYYEPYYGSYFLPFL